MRPSRLARAIDDPYSQAVALAYGSITYQMRHDLPELRNTVDELRELCDRYDFAYYREWALILDGWSAADQAGIGLAQRGIGNLKSQGAFARMPYWLSLLADLSARDSRPGAARATLDAALAAGRVHDDVWWLPEVMRMRAAYDEEQAAVARLLAAAQMASEHGSVALLRRCERDLGTRNVRPSRSERSPGGVAPSAPIRTLRERRGPYLRCAPNFNDAPEGGDMTTSTATTTAPYAELAATVRGDLILPGDPGYDQARAVYNAMIDKHPAAIARCRDTADVITCVRFAREHGIEIAVRGGGHNAAGLGCGTTRWSSTCRCCAARRSTRRIIPSAPTPDAPGETSTMRPWRSAWPPLPASWPRPAWPA